MCVYLDLFFFLLIDTHRPSSVSKKLLSTIENEVKYGCVLQSVYKMVKLENQHLSIFRQCDDVCASEPLENPIDRLHPNIGKGENFVGVCAR